jgi:putative membrane protein
VLRKALSYRSVPAQVARGFCMGAADVVPGVSGGTIALVLGIYTKLIDAVREGAVALGRLARGNVSGSLRALGQVDWLFLIPLLAGIGIAILSLAHTIEVLLEEQPVRMAAAFFGLVVGSLVVTARLVRRDAARLAVLVVVAVAAFLLLGLRSGPVGDPAVWFVFVAGAIAICAMILPGVSGSFLLLMLGMYDYVLGAVNERDLAVIAVFGVGAVLGLAVFSSMLHWALNVHTDVVLAALVGLMAGSLRVLWPWPEGTEGTSLAAPADDVLVPVLIAAVAALVVVGISRLASEREQRTEVVDAAEHTIE